MNLNDTSGNGTHWVAWLKRGNDTFYFDSFGLSPPTELNNLFNGDVFCPTEQIPPRQEVFLWSSLSFCFQRDAKRKRATGNNKQILVI